MVYPCNGTWLSHKKEQSTDTCHNVEPLKTRCRLREARRRRPQAVGIHSVQNSPIHRARAQMKRGLGWAAGTERLQRGTRGSFWGDGNVLKWGCHEGCAPLQISQKNHWNSVFSFLFTFPWRLLNKTVTPPSQYNHLNPDFIRRDLFFPSLN